MITVRVRKRPDREHLQLVYTDPVTGKPRTRSAETDDWKQAERAAARWEEELNGNFGTGKLSWDNFRYRFEEEHMGTLSENTQDNYFYGLNKFEKIMGKPRDIRAINASLVSQYTTRLRKQLKSESSVASNLLVLRSVLGWAASVGLITAAPKIRVPTIESRGRPISLWEFTHFVSRIRKYDDYGEAESMTRLLLVMWLGGLRLGEALKLHMTKPPVKVDFSGRRPAIAWSKGGQKSKRIERSPIAPDFARYLGRFKTGFVVNCPLARKTISTRIQEAGQGITSHDLRRTFGTRWALRVHPLVLKAMMRHRTLETTMKYYVDLETDDVADQIWQHSNENGRVKSN